MSPESNGLLVQLCVPTHLFPQILALYLKCIVSCFLLMESFLRSLRGNHDWHVLGGNIFNQKNKERKIRTFTLSNTEAFLDLDGWYIRLVRHNILFFFVLVIKEAPPGSGHFESRESSNVIQRRSESTKAPSTENKVLKERSMHSNQWQVLRNFFLSQRKIQPQQVLLLQRKGFRDKRY